LSHNYVHERDALSTIKIANTIKIEDALELTLKNNEIVLTPVHKKPREGWAEAFEAAAGKYSEEPANRVWLDAELIKSGPLIRHA